MFSELRPGLIYRDVSRDISVHDDDFDADEWEYDGRTVFRGSFDPEYLSQTLHVYSLYDDHTSLRVGIVEHEMNDPEIFHVMWFRDNPFEMLIQEDGWEPKCTLWSLLSNEAYQDCLEDDFKTIFDKCLMSKKCLVTPEFIINPPTLYECFRCNKKSLSQLNCCSTAKASVLDFNNFSILFFDDSTYYVISPPKDSLIFSKMSLRPHDASEAQQEQVPEHPPPSLPESQ